VAVKIRLKRIGRKNTPWYRIIAVDERRSVNSGLYLDKLGDYDPKNGAKNLAGDKILDWIKKGAQVSTRVKKILTTAKII
jgi:small subunit ribosomal protein S16